MAFYGKYGTIKVKYSTEFSCTETMFSNSRWSFGRFVNQTQKSLSFLKIHIWRVMIAYFYGGQPTNEIS